MKMKLSSKFRDIAYILCTFINLKLESKPCSSSLKFICCMLQNGTEAAGSRETVKKKRRKETVEEQMDFLQDIYVICEIQ